MKISKVINEMSRLIYVKDYKEMIQGIHVLSITLDTEGIQDDDPADVEIQRWLSDPGAFPIEARKVAAYVQGLQTTVTDLTAQVTTLQQATVEVTPTTTPPVV